MKRLVVVLAAMSMTFVLARCGGPGPESPDASSTTGKDTGPSSKKDGGATEEDGSTTNPADGAVLPDGDASTVVTGDTGTVLPDGDASTVVTGDSGAVQPGPDASTVVTSDGGSTGPCDPFAQTGCPGQKCTIDTSNGAFVCSAAGAKTDQQDCAAETDCAAGLACVQINGESGPKCRAFCSTAQKCPTGQACIVGAQGSTSAILCAAVPACDPYAQTGCQSGQKCTLADDTPTWTCGPAGAKTDQQTCASDGECAAGTVCLNFGAGFKCTSICSATKACPTGQSCLGGSASSEDPFACMPTPACNPLTQDCANADEGCFPKSQTEWACFHSMGKATGAACTYANDCIEGDVCAGSPGACMQLCDPAGGAPTCPSGKSCANFIGSTGVCN